MPERILPAGALVRVVSIHGTKAKIITASGDAVTVKLAELHLVAEAPPAEQSAIQPPAVATPPPPPPAPAPNPARPAALPSPTTAPASSPQQTSGNAGKVTTPGPSDETVKRSVPVRCSHLTKNGEQCSRMTTSPNGFCWQHGGN